jgi:hypothetical protein
MKYVRTLNLPHPPEYIVNKTLDIVNDKTHIKNMQIGPKTINNTTGTTGWGYDRFIEYQGQQIRCANVKRYPFDDETYDWFESNIFSKIKDCKKYQISNQIILNGKILHPHTDGPRGPFVLSYMIDTGGDNVDTIWYQEIENEIYRSPSTNLLYLDTLRELERIKVEPYNWVLMDARVIHTVKFMESPRIMLSVGMLLDEYKDFLKENNLENTFLNC